MIARFASNNSNVVEYGGVLKFDDTVKTLQKHFAMLFPTFYYGEGLPGNAIDAFYSAIPLIATDWKYNREIINDGVNGFLVPIHDPIAISEVLVKLYRDRLLQKNIALNNLTESKKYQPEYVLKEFYNILDC